MLKSEAVTLLGGTIPAAADAVGVTYQAVDKWPNVLPPRIADRVQAALYRIANGLPHPVIADAEPAKAES